MTWRFVSALLAGLVIQLLLPLYHLVQLFVFQDLPAPHPQGLWDGVVVLLAVGLASGLAVGVMAGSRPLLLGAVNALTPLGFYVLYYIGFLIYGLIVSGGDSGFAGGLIVLMWQKLWLTYLVHFAVKLAASVAGAWVGVALTPAPRAA
jgi:hypothetical protein